MGITYDEERQCFVFDFEHDGEKDILTLTGETCQMEAFGKCFYFAYEFAQQVDGTLRSQFIKRVKFPESLKDDRDLQHFIQKAVNGLNDKVNLYNYDLVVMPESSSPVNQYMLRYIYRFAQPTLRGLELVKNLPANISFDKDAYCRQYLDDVLENGRPRYTETQKSEVLQSIDQMMTLIRQKDYFTIARDVRKSKMRPYIMNFLSFRNEADRELCAAIRRHNILVIDDVVTSGSTLNEVLRTLRILNEDNDITIFSLIGHRELMADSF